MKLFVLGATGKMGSEIVSLALSRGHEVTAFVRSPEKLSPASALTIVKGVEAMTTSGVPRLVIISAAVLFPEKGLYFAFFRWLTKHHARDLRGMEAIVRSSGLAWTIARPPRLTRSPDTTFRAARDAVPPGSRVMSFRSVAAFMLEAAERQSHIREVVGLG